jgi:hypothetical protein
VDASDDDRARAAADGTRLPVDRAFREIRHMKYDLNSGHIPPSIELIILVTPFYGMARLRVIEIEEGIVFEDIVDELVMSDAAAVSTAAGILQHFVTPLSNKLKAEPSVAGDALQRITLMSSSPTFLLRDISQQFQTISAGSPNSCSHRGPSRGVRNGNRLVGL